MHWIVVQIKVNIHLTHDDEQDCEDDEAHQLDGLASPGVNE